MKVAYFDAFSGAAGDMIIASLLDAGCDREELERILAGLNVEHYRIDVRREMRHGIAATRFIVHLDEPHHHDHGHAHAHHHRTWADIREMILAADLPGGARDRAVAIFSRLAEAEAAVHGTEPDAVHFHEVGAVDSIVDIVGTAVALELMGIERVVSSPLAIGSGTVECAHGVLPVPAPATAELLKGVPLRPAPSKGDHQETGELLTPTGAAILTTLADRFGPPPAMTAEAVGYGAGSRQGAHAPNVLRVMIGETTADEGLDADGVWVIETNLDDTTAEVVADAAGRLLAAGALDVYTMAATMKKGRTGLVLSCLAHEGERAICERLLFEHTGTFGVRRHWCQRSLLARRHETVETPYGSVRVKIGRMGDRDLRAAPEFEDCRQAARAAGVSVQAVMQAALRAYQERDDA
jgi:pyridinium-3,5-bisthiocarboxylic acid mononucleotide nickel chelatase